MNDAERSELLLTVSNDDDDITSNDTTSDDDASDSRQQQNVRNAATTTATSSVFQQNANINSNESSSNAEICRKNIQYTLRYTFFSQMGRSVWSQSVLTTYVYLIRNNHVTDVGYITAIMGISQLLVSFPTGILTDQRRCGRHSILRIGGGIGGLAVLLSVLACCYTRYEFLVAALVLWGCVYGICNTVLTALFADCILPDDPRDRSYYFTQRSMLRTIGNITGPITSLVMFTILGNTWSIRDCSIVMVTGQMVCIPSILILLFCFQENTAAPPQRTATTTISSLNNFDNPSSDLTAPLLQDSDRQQPESGGSSALENDEEECVSNDATFTTNETQSLAASAEDSTVAATNSDGDVNETDDTMNTVICCGNIVTRVCCIPDHMVIPSIIAMSDIISGLGSGMSVRYFPLFFMDILQLQPIYVQSIYILCPILQTALMKLSQHLSTTYGRCTVTVLFKWIGILFMILMIQCYKYLHHRQQQSSNGDDDTMLPTLSLVLIGTLFIVRTSFMNSCGALTKSMLMDNVCSSQRGKWSALESVNMFSWSGSAAVGGILVGYYGMLPLFYTTAFIQFLASLLILSLVRVD